MDGTVVKQGIMPQINSRGKALIVATTPNREPNWLDEACAKVNAETGETYFKSVTLAAVCPSCFEAGERSVCYHNAHRIPRHHSDEVTQMMKDLMDDEEMAAEELGGLSIQRHNCAFHTNNVRLLEESVPRSLSSLPGGTVVTSWDPSGGGPSRQAAMSILYHGPFRVIVGVEYEPLSDPETALSLVYNHSLKITRDPRFAKCRHIGVVEQNMGKLNAHVIQNEMKKAYRGYRMLTTCPAKHRRVSADVSGLRHTSVGVLTTNDSKRGGVELVNSYLSTGGLEFADDIICAGTTFAKTVDRSGRRGKMFPRIRAALCNEMRHFVRIMPLDEKYTPGRAREAMTRRCIRYSGKKNFTDDLVMAMLLNVYFFETYRRMPENFILEP